jgi:hypothetical protein
VDWSFALSSSWRATMKSSHCSSASRQYAMKADLQEVYETERQLLYVACTRARDHLLVTGVKPASEFLDDFDQDMATGAWRAAVKPAACGVGVASLRSQQVQSKLSSLAGCGAEWSAVAIPGKEVHCGRLGLGPMADLYCLSNSRGAPKAHVIFLHGLGGHPYRTWEAMPDENALWPRWLAEDIRGLAVWSVGYEAPISRWKGTAMHLVDRAENILGRLLTRPELRTGRIILIGHSLGGLVIKQLFRTLEMEARTNAAAASLLDRIDKVAFLATPHTGADLAIAGDRLRVLVRPSAAALCLVRNDPRP